MFWGCSGAAVPSLPSEQWPPAQLSSACWLGCPGSVPSAAQHHGSGAWTMRAQVLLPNLLWLSRLARGAGGGRGGGTSAGRGGRTGSRAGTARDGQQHLQQRREKATRLSCQCRPRQVPRGAPGRYRWVQVETARCKRQGWHQQPHAAGACSQHGNPGTHPLQLKALQKQTQAPALVVLGLPPRLLLGLGLLPALHLSSSVCEGVRGLGGKKAPPSSSAAVPGPPKCWHAGPALPAVWRPGRAKVGPWPAAPPPRPAAPSPPSRPAALLPAGSERWRWWRCQPQSQRAGPCPGRTPPRLQVGQARRAVGAQACKRRALGAPASQAVISLASRVPENCPTSARGLGQGQLAGRREPLLLHYEGRHSPHLPAARARTQGIIAK